MNQSRHKYIAVIDDDESLCRALGRLLHVSGYHPIAYSSAEEFLADTGHPWFDCLVLDVQLGGISGLELHRRLVSAGSTTPVIYLTAHDDLVTRRQASESGYAAFLNKTDPTDVLLSALAEAIRCQH